MDEQAVKILLQAMLEPILADIKELFKRTNSSEVWQAKYGEKIDKIEKLIEKLSEKVTETPAKRWDLIVSVALTAIVTYVVAKMLGK